MTKKISIAAFCGAVLALVLWLFCGPDVAAEAVYPVENGANWFSRTVVRRVKAAFASGSALIENERLRAEVARLKMACAEADRTAAENARLRGLLGLDASDASVRFGTNAWICAPIISRGAAAGNPCVLRLGAGLRAGVKSGAVVAVPEGLVGRIGNVTPNTSELRLITDPSMRISCDIELGGTQAGYMHGILSGRGLNPVAATETSILYTVPPLLLSNLALRSIDPPRAKIITSGLGGVFPRGLLVGFLRNGVRGDATKLEQEGDVEPAVDFLTLENVFIRRAD